MAQRFIKMAELNEYMESFEWPIKDNNILKEIQTHLVDEFGFSEEKVKILLIQLQYIGKIEKAKNLKEVKVILANLVIFIFEPYLMACDSSEKSE